MPEYTLPLTPPLPARLVDELVKRLYYVDGRITDFTVNTEDGQAREVRVVTELEVDTDELVGKIDRLIHSDVLRQRIVPSEVTWRSKNAPDTIRDIYEELIASGVVWEAAPGQVAVGEPFLTLMSFFDEEIRRLALDRFGAAEYRYPALIPTQVLARSGYLSSFPQYVLLADLLHCDLDVYRSFAAKVAGEEFDAESLDSYGTHAGLAVLPAVCYHTYHHFADTRLAVPLKTITARGKCFRNESRYRRSLERLWDFTMREVVFLGSQDSVFECREAFMTDIFSLIEELGLAAHCEPANDPFFAGPRTAQQVWSQKVLELKFELRLPVSPDHTVAAASFNVHGDHLGRAFAIGVGDDTYASTACMAFGLERLAYGFLCQYGLELGRWPERVREILEGRHPHLDV
ncbi:class-II aminoacyl-tRNA synthetase family protein [Streptomyces pseudovenezuelae]|uniref:hypothetical protein n=1 Tax=Streptomyces pseudovenezuelae TaxID=67350 RepID=UPI0037248B0D